MSSGTAGPQLSPWTTEKLPSPHAVDSSIRSQGQRGPEVCRAQRRRTLQTSLNLSDRMMASGRSLNWASVVMTWDDIATFLPQIPSGPFQQHALEFGELSFHPGRLLPYMRLSPESPGREALADRAGCLLRIINNPNKPVVLEVLLLT